MVDSVVDRRVGGQVKLIKDVRFPVRICFYHFRRVVEQNMVDLMADDIDNLLQRKPAEQQRVGLKHRREAVQLNSGDYTGEKVHLELHIDEKVAIIAVPLRDQEELEQLHELQKIRPHLVQQSLPAISALYGCDTRFDPLQQSGNIIRHYLLSSISLLV